MTAAPPALMIGGTFSTVTVVSALALAPCESVAVTRTPAIAGPLLAENEATFPAAVSDADPETSVHVTVIGSSSSSVAVAVSVSGAAPSVVVKAGGTDTRGGRFGTDCVMTADVEALNSPSPENVAAIG